MDESTNVKTPPSKKVKIRHTNKSKKSLPETKVEFSPELLSTSKEPPKTPKTGKKKLCTPKKIGTDDPNLDKVLLLEPAPLLVGQIDEPIKKKLKLKPKKDSSKDKSQLLPTKRKVTKRSKQKDKEEPVQDTKKKTKRRAKRKLSHKRSTESQRPQIIINDEKDEDFLFGPDFSANRLQDAKSVMHIHKDKLNISDSKSVKAPKKHKSKGSDPHMPNINPEAQEVFKMITKNLTPVVSSQPIIGVEKPIPLQTIMDDITIDESKNAFSSHKSRSKRLHKKLSYGTSGTVKPVEGWLPFGIGIIQPPDDVEIEKNATRDYDIRKLVHDIKHN
ncbi:hypothetical protein TVAG_191740 [Trichomonas vaginalis G3]|uniref:Uncharacterized protein n=1 Tax=Trichomonas vaginalis (strain ATCC PRA-98 / G3) TaxID=412133 RepID=A2EQN0_TRIV3|nr:hypothetical protein TVAGG3_0976950 [Trichomonas vaginalis G3]EAY05077.1 hypothetical protein TVAG_191740 [Trichomonas vaginalis G3]KAI5489009.1 hypothetical protein TVAGG3_0976950 [Trichomonas vaginalis G3]|eukprot:XP_001317300.1 hypothetical protein [Trichomonas vaginalis G3]